MSTSVQMRDNLETSPWKTLTGLTGLRVSWELNRAGVMTFSIPYSEMLAQSLGATDMLGYLVQYTHANAGSWSGVVTMHVDRNGIIEVTAQSYEILLKKRLVAISGYKNTAPGVVLKAALDNFATLPGLPTKIRYSKTATVNDAGYVDVTTKRVNIAANAAIDFYDELIPQLTDAVNMEWRVDANRLVTYKPRLGSDLSSVFTLGVGSVASPGAVASYEVSRDLFAMTNYISGWGMAPQTTKSTAAASSTLRGKPQASAKAASGISNQTSTANATTTFVPINQYAYDSNLGNAYGSLMERRDYPRIDTAGELKARVDQDLERIKYMRPVYTLDVIEWMPSGGSYWLAFREGDTVTVQTPSSTRKARVMARALDMDRSIMTVAAIAEPL